MPKIFVTGGHGFLGGYLLPRLAAHAVTAPTHAQLEIRDTPAVLKAFKETRPDVVIHLAALCGAKPSQEQPALFFDVNAQGAVSVLEACRLAGVPKMLFTSSMTVFGEGKSAQQVDSPFAPRHPYASAKVGAEFAVRSYARNYGLGALILRPTLVVGEGYREPHAIGDFVETVRSGRVIEIYGDGSHVRDFVHPEDVASAMVKSVEWLAASRPGQVESVNLSNDQPTTVSALADLVIARCGRGEKRFVASTSQSFSLFADSRRAAELLGMKAAIGNDRIIDRLWKK